MTGTQKSLLPEFWNLLDNTLMRLETLRIQADLILLHPYDKWGFETHGETYMERMDHDQVLWWSKGSKLKGQSPARIAFLKELLSEMPGNMFLFHVSDEDGII